MYNGTNSFIQTPIYTYNALTESITLSLNIIVLIITI